MATGITSPGSALGRPLTPLPTAEKPLSESAQSVVTYLRLHRAGHRPRFWWEVQLKPDDYTEVLHMLNLDKSLCDYVEDKVRYDYDTRRHCLTFRMPSPVHDTFCARIVDEVLQQLRHFQRDNRLLVAEFVKQIEHFATSRILIPEDVQDGKQTYSRREPDASFGHRQALYPGVIVEICYSQKSKRISHLADDYILNTAGSVNVVIALDIDYQGSKRATMTVWRPEYTTLDGVEEFRATAVIEAQPFRTDSGLPTKETTLRLSLRDFATEELLRGNIDLDREIIITSKQLCDYLSGAEARQQAHTQHQGSINQIRPGALKRRRPQTPPEHISSEGEGSFEGERQRKRGCRSSDYHPSSPSGDSVNEIN
ncbi:unnamed protein product [Penicillium salamii]|uniref:Uncharacterized protein n=1 Tax=Penicillium salamii TaxID=1612424 RepID=A0A9W4NS16_9EURO|nr:unnamed protein product [Penicillium salamii]CAG8052630.1 unnamed protein product [Penicillium salamii]CAG8105690.1 unnamed protein product [Penicillium salamii]CAG8139845.1 unnamed protein product [Penicillium salamii]CAG8276767.1 unnamed protein product [Penicillium salamii]